MTTIVARLVLTASLPAFAPLALARTPAAARVPNAGLVSLEIWSWKGTNDALQAAGAEFAEYYPNTQMPFVNRPAGYNDQQIQYGGVAGGGLPNVANGENSHLQQFVDTGNLCDFLLPPELPHSRQRRGFREGVSDDCDHIARDAPNPSSDLSKGRCDALLRRRLLP